MTVTATNRKEQFTTNGVTTEFTFTFAITDTSQVYAFTVLDDVETEYTDFTVIASNDVEGGTLTTNSVLSGVDLLIYRDVALTQQVDYESGGRFPADSHEQALDKLTLQNQDQQEELDRALKTSISVGEGYEVEELENGKILAFEDGKIISSDGNYSDLETLGDYTDFIVEWTTTTDVETETPEGEDIRTLAGIQADVDQVIENVYRFTIDTVADIPNVSPEVLGLRVQWMGYYSVGDGGSNWGVIKQGDHTADGGSIFTISGDYYIEANLKGSRVNVLKFGAIDGSFSTSAFEAAFAYAYGDETIKKIYVPAGRYRLERKLNSYTGISLIGDGYNYSQLVWVSTSTSSGINVEIPTTLDYTVQVEGLSLQVFALVGDKALSVTGESGSGYLGIRRGTISNVSIRGDASDTSSTSPKSYFETGIYTKNIAGLTINNCVFHGSKTDANSDTEVGPYYLGIGIHQDDDDNNTEVSSHCTISDCQFTYLHECIHTSSSEGMEITGPRCVSVDFGVVADNIGHLDLTEGAPAFKLYGGHMACKMGAVYMTYGAGHVVKNCSISYRLTHNLNNYSHISLYDSGSCEASDNSFFCNNYAIEAGVLLDNSLNNAMRNNYFHGLHENAFKATNGSRFNLLQGTFLGDNVENLAALEDDTSFMQLGGYARLVTTSVKAMATASSPVEWSELNPTPLGVDRVFDSSSPTSMSIPFSGTYTIFASLIIDSDTADNTINANIMVNGSSLVGSGRVIYSSTDSGVFYVQVQSSPLNLSHNDLITVNVSSTAAYSINPASTLDITYTSSRT